MWSCWPPTNGCFRGPFVNHGGVEVGTEGDALFFVFADAPQAVAACLEGQRALATHPWPPGVVLRVRIGLHTSEATPVGNDYVDLAVHQVARISAGAHGGQFLLSAATATAVEGRLPADAALVPLGSFQLRGFPEPQPPVPARSPGPSPRFPAPAPDRRRRSQPAVPAGRFRRANRGAEGSCLAAVG